MGKLVTTAELCELLDVSATTVLRWRKDGVIPGEQSNEENGQPYYYNLKDAVDAIYKHTLSRNDKHPLKLHLRQKLSQAQP